MTEKTQRGVLGVGGWRLVEREGGNKIEHVGTAVFDELVVGGWLHIEQLEVGVCWMRVGDARLTVSLEPDGGATVDVQRGFYGEVRGETSEHETP